MRIFKQSFVVLLPATTATAFARTGKYEWKEPVSGGLYQSMLAKKIPSLLLHM